MRDIVRSIEEEYVRYKKLGEGALAQVANVVCVPAMVLVEKVLAMVSSFIESKG